MSLEPGQTLDNKYRIVRLIGEGGMGTVHEGENLLIRRRVAIKVLNAQAARNEAALVRFEREAQAAGRIGSDHILEIIDLGVLPTGERYMVMEYLDGETLSQRIERAGQLAPPTLYPLIRQALVGLKAAHLAEIVHRDLKPENIFILREKAGQADFVKIIDFGVSKFRARGGELSMTRTGAVMGTPYYMSPEQARGSKDLDARSDLYSMGVILYEALTGQVPFSGETFNELIFKIVSEDPIPLTTRLPDVDPAFAGIVQMAMAREAAHRFQSAEAMSAALDAWASSVGLEVPRVSSLPSMIPEASPTTSFRATPPPRSTGSSWASSRHPAARTSRALPVALGVVALGALLLAGGGYAAYRLLGASTGAVIQSASPPVSGTAVVDPSAQPGGSLAPESKVIDEELAGSDSTGSAKREQASGPRVKPVHPDDEQRAKLDGDARDGAASKSTDTVNSGSKAAPKRSVGLKAIRKQPSRKQQAPDFGY